MHIFSLLAMFVGTSMASSYDLDLFTSDLDLNPILSDGPRLDIPSDDDLFTFPDPSDETPTDTNMGSQISLGETYTGVNMGNEISMDDSETFSNIFNFESKSPDMSVALLDPELQPLERAPDCEENRSILCCDPTKEFFPDAVDGCIYCTNAAYFRISPALPVHPAPPWLL